MTPGGTVGRPDRGADGAEQDGVGLASSSRTESGSTSPVRT